MIAALARRPAAARAEQPGQAMMLGALSLASFLVGLAVGVAVMGALLGATTGAEMMSRLSLGLKVNAGVAAAGALAAVWLLPTARQSARRLAGLKPARGTMDGGD